MRGSMGNNDFLALDFALGLGSIGIYLAIKESDMAHTCSSILPGTSAWNSTI